VALREESYYTATIQKAFTAYSSRKFHIASPLFRKMIATRIDYAIDVLESGTERLEMIAPSGIVVDRDAVIGFLRIVEHSVFERNRNIARFIEHICFGNMRLALQMFTNFLTSGATDVDKMLGIYSRDGAYYVAFHEFVKSIMLGERAYYKESQSPVLNIFDCGAEPNSSHFTGLRIIKFLLAYRAESTPEGQGYVDLGRMALLFEDVFDAREDFIRTMDRLVRRQLVETNTRSMEGVLGSSHVRVTAAGWYYERELVRSFAYLDLVLQDTPVSDAELEKDLRESVYRVNNLGDREDEKLDRMDVRFSRVEKFLLYLSGEEKEERKSYALEGLDSIVSEPVMAPIAAAYFEQKSWIQRRLRENREKFAEDVLFETAGERVDLESLAAVPAPEEGDDQAE
jgi:hypothetical protein